MRNIKFPIQRNHALIVWPLASRADLGAKHLITWRESPFWPL